MKHYIGIDLGTTNSAICSYNGASVRIWKSPEQNDVTPSVIYVDRRGNRYYGSKAYNQAPYNPNNSARLFKRFMGTATKIKLEATNLTLSPEECSAEILKVLYGYLPEEIRNDPETATVITVPAAFNQMKKDATLQAAKLAGLGRVALMQEPVAAIMSIMRTSPSNGIFLVYDLGGGTFDVSIAESTNGKVNLLAHGGIEMCGGRDIDRTLFNQYVLPWIRNNFDLPDDFIVNKKYKTFCSIAQWATERAKIELSSVDTSTIALSENEARTLDESGNEMYLDVDITRDNVNSVMDKLISETIDATRETLEKAGLNANNLERVVFVGGPTNYKPLRDRVCAELALPCSLDINPMTAVAEGASIFAESIDWSTSSHTRKAQNKVASTELSLSFKYTARVTGSKAKLMCVLDKPMPNYSIQFISMDSGWTSGCALLSNGLKIELPLVQQGENSFRYEVLDSFGQTVPNGSGIITITKTIASIGAIPASHSIGVEVIEKLGGTPVLEFLVSEGDSLPKRGSITFKAGQTLRAGSNDSINIKLWEGETISPITDNRFIGVLKISGRDILSGIVPTGADIECEYMMSDSGTINLEISIPCIGASFSGHNFYSRQEGQQDLTDIDSIAQQGRDVVQRIEQISSKINSPMLETAHKKASLAAELDVQQSPDPEDVQKASNELLDAKKLLNKVRNENLKTIRKIELDNCLNEFSGILQGRLSPEDQQAIDTLINVAQRSIEQNSSDFEDIINAIKSKYTAILLRQDWFIIDLYNALVSNPLSYTDLSQFISLKQKGDRELTAGNIDALRQTIAALMSIRIHAASDDGMFDIANILKS